MTGGREVDAPAAGGEVPPGRPSRWLVVGSAGAGKSVFCRRLGTLLDLPVVHLDRLYWEPGWTPAPDEVWLRRLDEALARPSWIVDGNYGATLPRRLRRAEAVVFLDLPRRVCLAGVVGRRLAAPFRRQVGLPDGCRARLRPGFLLWVWRYPSRSRPLVEAALAE
ncbi:MAG TPA: hypothetical protein VLL48_01745, partial [Longimicrobiales bacterium]|nr:hypothetical protein [Longimicrobiales bacterium]